MKIKSIDLRKPEYAAVIFTFFFGLFVHLFGLVNILHNYDDIFNQPIGYGSGLTSGRWFLSILGKISLHTFSGYNLPWFNGVFFILLIAVSAGFLVSVFEIRSSKSAVLVGMALVSFPSVTSTLFFKYTVIYYGIAILLAVLAAWIISRHKYGFFLSAVFTALSLGIYQAYLPITVSIFLILLLKETLQGNSTLPKLIQRGIFYCGSIILGLVVYFVALRLLLNVLSTSLDSYQGISDMGSLSLAALPGLLREVWSSFWIPAYSLAQIPVLKLAYIFLHLSIFMLIAANLFSRRLKPHLILFTVFLYILYPIAINLIVLMCPNSHIYTLMVYSFALLLCTPLVLWESLPAPAAPRRGTAYRLIILILCFIVFCNCYLANVNYTAMYYSNRQAENYMSSLVTQIRMTDGFDTSKKWAFIGQIDDPLLDSEWQNVAKYGGNVSAETLLTVYSWNDWIDHYIGYRVEYVSPETLEILKASQEIAEMSCWPNAGSIKVTDDMVIVKFQNP